jgi:hypothetical protein
MYDTLKFNKEAIQEAEDYYNTLHLASGQRIIAQGIAKIVANYIPLDVMPLMGFIWRVMRTWQIEHKIDMKEVGEKFTGQQKIKVVSELIDMAYKDLTRVLINKEQEPLLKKGLNEVFEFYKKNFAYR